MDVIVLNAYLWKSRYKNKKGKWIYIQTDSGKESGARVCSALSFWKIPKYFYHLQKGGHVSALKSHLIDSQNEPLGSDRWFSRFDINNFYGSVTRNKLVRALKPLVGYERASDIANCSLVADPESSQKTLPFGFVQSPILASIFLHNCYLGRELESLYASGDVNVTVFVDDIILSSSDKNALVSATSRIVDAFEKSNLTKSRVKCGLVTKELSAFNVLTDGSFLKLNDEKVEDFVSRLALSTVADGHNEFVVDGIVSYWDSISDSQRKQCIKEVVLNIGRSRAGLLLNKQ